MDTKTFFLKVFELKYAFKHDVCAGEKKICVIQLSPPNDETLTHKSWISAIDVNEQTQFNAELDLHAPGHWLIHLSMEKYNFAKIQFYVNTICVHNN